MIQQTKWVSGPNGGLVSANYAWTSDGQIASIQGPVNAQYTYDAMGRQQTVNTVNTATWGPAGELTSLSSGATGYPYISVNEARSYNSLLQLTRMTSTRLQSNVPTGTLMDMQYVYNDGQNNGRIAEARDLANGEDALYAYDSLQRLIGAHAANPGGFEDGLI